ncbi:MAG: MBL fold metallo-hydrolase [Saprospiraceae bacterium]|nr:MAG: MBL fold metallo-hydrolase [Saprospiraceae bacterium]
MKDNATWKIKFFGSRGSIPVCETDFQWYGGNTTCIYLEIIQEAHIFAGIIDAGSGIRNLGKDFLKGEKNLPDNIFMFFTHFHWDHIQGFPFFAPAYNRDQHITIFAPIEGKDVHDLKQIFEVPMQEEYFPVKLDEMGAKFNFFTKGDLNKFIDLTKLDNLLINQHDHPGKAYGYRFEHQNKSIVICTDVEHKEGIDENLVKFSQNADLLIHDAQYTTDELTKYRNWGHSSYEQAIEVAKKANVKQLIMTHHDPDHNDEFLFEMEKKCMRIFPNSALARDGLEILL